MKNAALKQILMQLFIKYQKPMPRTATLFPLNNKTHQPILPMKKVLFLAFGLAPFFLNAQFSKKATSEMTGDTLQSVLDLKLTLSSDTSKARIIVFSKGDTDQFLSWMEGFVVAKNYKLPNGTVLTSAGNIAYNKNWQIINPDMIYDVKLLNPPAATRKQ